MDTDDVFFFFFQPFSFLFFFLSVAMTTKWLYGMHFKTQDREGGVTRSLVMAG